MVIIGIALLFLSGLYPLRTYVTSHRIRLEKYSAVLSMLHRINDKISSTGTDLYEIFRDFYCIAAHADCLPLCAEIFCKGCHGGKCKRLVSARKTIGGYICNLT